VVNLLAVVAAPGVAAIGAVLWYRHRAAKLEHALDVASHQLEHLQTAFHRFAPQEVVEDIIRKGVSVRGERREVTVMFADLVGFTAMSEQMDPAALVQVLNGYFEAMSRAITANRGHVSKFIGDGILALFGAPDPNPWQAIDAVAAAVAMRSALAGYNATLEGKGLPRLGIGIGLHIGPVIAGVVGSRDLIEYTVIGDTVNTAARIESLTRKAGTAILLSDAVTLRLDQRWPLRACEPMTVKGKTEPVLTWALDG